MIVCHCRAVSDRAISKAIRGGASSPREVARACGAGRVCGGCRPAVRQLIERERNDEPTSDAITLGVEASLVAAG